VGRPAEASFFQSLREHPETGSIPIEDFEKVFSFVGKKKSGSTQWIECELVSYFDAETVETFAHITGLCCKIDPQAVIECKHYF